MILLLLEVYKMEENFEEYVKKQLESINTKLFNMEKELENIEQNTRR